jgi:hypothetical protein
MGGGAFKRLSLPGSQSPSLCWQNNYRLKCEMWPNFLCKICHIHLSYILELRVSFGGSSILGRVVVDLVLKLTIMPIFNKEGNKLLIKLYPLPIAE